MNEQQALNVIKQVLDQAMKAGVCNSVETAGILAQAWKVISSKLTEEK